MGGAVGASVGCVGAPVVDTNGVGDAVVDTGDGVIGDTGVVTGDGVVGTRTGVVEGDAVVSGVVDSGVGKVGAVIVGGLVGSGSGCGSANP